MSKSTKRDLKLFEAYASDWSWIVLSTGFITIVLFFLKIYKISLFFFFMCLISCITLQKYCNWIEILEKRHKEAYYNPNRKKRKRDGRRKKSKYDEVVF